MRGLRGSAPGLKGENRAGRYLVDERRQQRPAFGTRGTVVSFGPTAGQDRDRRIKADGDAPRPLADRKSVAQGTSAPVRVHLGARPPIQKKHPPPPPTPTPPP